MRMLVTYIEPDDFIYGAVLHKTKWYFTIFMTNGDLQNIPLNLQISYVITNGAHKESNCICSPTLTTSHIFSEIRCCGHTGECVTCISIHEHDHIVIVSTLACWHLAFISRCHCAWGKPKKSLIIALPLKLFGGRLSGFCVFTRLSCRRQHCLEPLYTGNH